MNIISMAHALNILYSNTKQFDKFFKIYLIKFVAQKQTKRIFIQRNNFVL